MSNRKSAGSNISLEPEQVVEFLNAHPDFFERNPQLVSQLKIAHSTGDAVSLIEKQVEILRKQNRTLERKLVDLIEVARANDASVERIHQLVLQILETDELPDLLHGLQDKLRHRFGADAVTLLLFVGDEKSVEFGPARRIARDHADMNEFQQVFRKSQPVVGRLRPRQKEILFGKAADGIGSAALIPIGDNAHIGLLAIGSLSEDQFGPTLGTTFLLRIGELLTIALRKYLHP